MKIGNYTSSKDWKMKKIYLAFFLMVQVLNYLENHFLKKQFQQRDF